MTGSRTTGARLLGVKRVGTFHHLSLVAEGVVERHRPGDFVLVAPGGGLSARVPRVALPVHRARPGGAVTASGGTLEVVLEHDPEDPGQAWLLGAPAGTTVDLLGPLGRPFALPKEPVTCVLVGVAAAAASLTGLAERLRERGSTVHMLLAGDDGPHLFGVLEARRSTRSVTVVTGDGSVGQRGTVADALPDLLARTGAEVVYAAGPPGELHAVAALAERHGAWSQTLLDVTTLGLACGTGLCFGCPVPVVAQNGVTRMVRGCHEGPVLRGDRVRWDDLGTVPEGAR